MDVFPIPPPDFLQKLHAFDSDLQLNWDHLHGVWQVYQRNEDGSLVHVINVVNDDGSYRPLDDRALRILKMNKYYAENPKELEGILVDSVEEADRRSFMREQEDLRYFAKDKALNRAFDKIVDSARGIPWNKWSQTHVLRKLENGKDNLIYKPDDSFRDKRKPSSNDLDDLRKQERVRNDLIQS